jgi:hypothetical protein
MCGARDGVAQAHMDVLAAFFHVAIPAPSRTDSTKKLAGSYETHCEYTCVRLGSAIPGLRTVS